MGDLNQKGGIQGFDWIEKRNSKLNSLWTAAFTGILICALLLTLPTVAVLSVLGFVFSAPFCFVFAVYSAINELLSIVLDLGKEDDMYDEEKIKEEEYEQDYELGELGTTSIGGQLGVIEASKDSEEVTNRGENDIRVEFDNEDKNVVPWTRMTWPFLSWGSSGEFGNLEQLLAPPEKETSDGLQEDCGAVEEQCRKIEPGELVRETMEMLNAVRNEGEVEIENIQQSSEEATSVLPAVSGSVHGAVLDLERMKLLSVEESVDDVPRLQTINEQLEMDKPRQEEGGALASLQVEIEQTTNTTMKVIPQNVDRLNPVRDVWNATYESMYHV